MKQRAFITGIFLAMFCGASLQSQNPIIFADVPDITMPRNPVLQTDVPDGSMTHAQNPIIFADVPDMSMIRLGETYYMSSTTMHMNPGVPIMKSTDLVNWKLTGYAYDMLDEKTDAQRLLHGTNEYGKGTWASCLRYHDSTYYLSTFSGSTNKTYIFTTTDIENGPWKKHTFTPAYHDHTLFFEDGKIYMIWGAGTLRIIELESDFSGVREETERILIENASAPAGDNIMLNAEGSQIFRVVGKYYLFNIVWPQNDMRTVLVHRADQLAGPYEGRVVLRDRGIAQGGIVDTPDGQWFAYLFRDYGSVGRIPYIAPVVWEDGWPVIGIDGKVPDRLDLPENKGPIPGIVASDDFSRSPGEPDLPLVWQWNHQPDNTYWSLHERPGYLRLKTGHIAEEFPEAPNTLTQRTFGPECSAATLLDVSEMKDGDFAGLALLQKNYGWVGVRCDADNKYITMINAETGEPETQEEIALPAEKIYLKASCDFQNRTDEAHFFYSLDGNSWHRIGETLRMSYTLPHFMGYRFALFNYATKSTGGYVDFDYFGIAD